MLVVVCKVPYCPSKETFLCQKCIKRVFNIKDDIWHLSVVEKTFTLKPTYCRMLHISDSQVTKFKTVCNMI